MFPWDSGSKLTQFYSNVRGTYSSFHSCRVPRALFLDRNLNVFHGNIFCTKVDEAANPVCGNQTNASRLQTSDPIPSTESPRLGLDASARRHPP